MPESEWWSLRLLPLTPEPTEGVGEGKGEESSPGQLGLQVSFDSHPPRYKINSSLQGQVR